ncbi:MAG: hypothetical protein ACREVL_13280 [Solimonas sp.]
MSDLPSGLVTERCLKWQPVLGIVGPCAEISFARPEPYRVSVTMHFSAEQSGQPQDLLLEFREVTGLRWEREFPGFEHYPENMPKCDKPWEGWSFPLLTVEGSAWLEQHRGVHEAASDLRLAHFVLLSSDDLLQVIATRDVSAHWVPAKERQLT